MNDLEMRTDGDPARVLIEELLRTALGVGGMLGALVEDLPEGAFPGEDNAAAVVEMAIGSCRPVIATAGEPACREAVALLGSIGDRIADDLRLAAGLARSGEHGHA